MLCTATLRHIRHGRRLMSTVGIEVRVHGIGDHGEFSSLGSHLRKVGEGAVWESEVGKREHRLVLLNWSRYTRTIFRFTWFLALPYSLANMAGHMVLPEVAAQPGWRQTVTEVRRSVSSALPHVFGLVLTVCTVPWIAA